MKLEQGLKQTLKVGINLQQTINMLQYSAVDMQQLISQELQNNPFLIDPDMLNIDADSSDEELSFDTSLDNIAEYDPAFADSYLSFNNIKNYNTSEDSDFITNIIEDTSLKAYITEQISLKFQDGIERLIAFYLTDMLEDSGYIILDVKALSEQLNCAEYLIEQVLTELQTFDPIGVFSRNLQECLKIQLIDKEIFNSSYETLLNYLPKLANKDYVSLAKLCKVTESEVKAMTNNIKALNPKPGNMFSNHKSIVKVPDVFIKFNKAGKLIVELNQENLPKIKLYKEYYSELKAKIKISEQKKFLSENYQSAGMLVNSVEQRNNAIFKVAESISRFQKGFFEKGILYLKPLTLQEVAKDVGVSESTVSRVTTNKYIGSHLGIFEMKYFFTSALQAKSSQEAFSSTKVKEIIKKIIEIEDTHKVISDDQISKELEKFNIKIARRTVAKYRDQLNIPTACIRRREKIDV